MSITISTIATTQTDTITYDYLTANGANVSKRIHTLIKLAKKQGVKQSGNYKYSGWNFTIEAINLTFTGPANVIRALRDALDNEFDRAEERRYRRYGY